MPMEPTKKTPEQIAFNKKIGKMFKLKPFVSWIKKDVGKAPKCGVTVKTETASTVSNNKKKR